MKIDIDLLRKKWKEAREEFRRFQRITEEREALADGIQNLEKKVHSDTLTFHRMQQYASSQVENMEEQIIAETENLREMQTKKQDLDTELDHLESFTFEEITQRQEDLAKAILQKDPDSRWTYENYVQGINQHHELIKILDLVGQMTQEMVDLLESILQERAKIKQMGFLQYIFGSNPNYVITKALQATGRIAGECKNQLQELIQRNLDQNYVEAFEKEIEHLDHLILFSKERWGFKKLDTQIPHELTMQRGFHKLISDHHQVLKLESEQLEQDLIKWLENFPG